MQEIRLISRSTQTSRQGPAEKCPITNETSRTDPQTPAQRWIDISYVDYARRCLDVMPSQPSSSGSRAHADEERNSRHRFGGFNAGMAGGFLRAEEG
jgi:hypothetical protein